MESKNEKRLANAVPELLREIGGIEKERDEALADLDALAEGKEK